LFQPDCSQGTVPRIVPPSLSLPEISDARSPRGPGGRFSADVWYGAGDRPRARPEIIVPGWFRRAGHHAGDRHGATGWLWQGVSSLDPRSVQGAGGGFLRWNGACRGGERRRVVGASAI